MSNVLPRQNSVPPGDKEKEKNAPAAPPPPADAAPPSSLTPEEQMALYEKELKETDWGHQPC